MNKDFLNLKNQEITPAIHSYIQLKEQKQKYQEIKNNILELILINHMESDKNLKRKNHSEPNSKYKRRNLKKKKGENKVKKVSQKNILKEDNDSDLNLNIEEDEKPINMEDLIEQQNKQFIKEKILNKNINSSNNLNANKRMSQDSKDFIEKIINSSGEMLNINERTSSNEILNANNIYSLKDHSSNNNNSNQNINLLNYCSNSNTNKSNTNYAFNFFGVNNQEDNSSVNSSKNELGKIKINNNNNRISNLSNSSLGKNFILKSEVCKSTFNNDIKYHNNNNSQDNLIMSYFSKDIKNKNFGNFYLLTDRKSSVETDQNKFINFFPVDEDSSKQKEKNIMSCNYIDNNNEIPEKINTDIINANDEYESEYNFKLNDFHQRTSKEEKLNLEKLIKNLGDNDTTDKLQVDTMFEKDDINGKVKTFIDKESINKENNVNNSNGNSIPYENNKNQFNINLNNDNDNEDKNINTKKINFNNNENNMNNNQNPLSFINNIYNINNSNYKQFQINPIINPGIPNYYFNPNMNINNPIMNYFNPFFPQFNYYQQFYNQKNNQFQSPFFNLSNNQNKINYNNTIYSNISNNNNADENKINLKVNNNAEKANDINNNNIYKDDNNKSIVINKQTDNKNDEITYNNIYNNNSYNNKINNNINMSNMNINNTFSLNKNVYELTDEEILNSPIKIINDQLGCRFMQEKIKSNHNFANELLFPKIKYNLKEICCDNFGNYFLQVLIDILSFDNINKFFDMTQNDFTAICVSPHGTRVIQKIIDKISATPILMNRFIYNLNSKDLGIIFKSPYGNHTIQKFLETTHSSEYSTFIFNYIFKYFLDIANSKHGVCVIQKCVSEGDEKQRAKIYELILNNFNNLIKDQFGNYLIQYILMHTKTEEKFKEILPIILKIEENIIDLCKSKYSANVIEKSFENSDKIISEHILDSLLKNNIDNLIDILFDQYGIYVIQKALKVNNIIYTNKLIEAINSKEKEIKNINFSDNKYKNILKIINSSQELGEILGKFIAVNANNSNEKYIYNNIYNNQEEKNRSEHYNFYNRGKNKKGRKYNNKINNNRY